MSDNYEHYGSKYCQFGVYGKYKNASKQFLRMAANRTATHSSNDTVTLGNFFENMGNKRYTSVRDLIRTMYDLCTGEHNYGKTLPASLDSLKDMLPENVEKAKKDMEWEITKYFYDRANKGEVCNIYVSRLTTSDAKYKGQKVVKLNGEFMLLLELDNAVYVAHKADGIKTNAAYEQMQEWLKNLPQGYDTADKNLLYLIADITNAGKCECTKQMYGSRAKSIIFAKMLESVSPGGEIVVTSTEGKPLEKGIYLYRLKGITYGVNGIVKYSENPYSYASKEQIKDALALSTYAE